MSLRKKILLAVILLPLGVGLLPRLYYQLLPCPVFNGVETPVPAEFFDRLKQMGVDASGFTKTYEARIPLQGDGPRYVSRFGVLRLRAALAWTVLNPSGLSEIVIHSPEWATALTAENSDGFVYELKLDREPFWHVSRIVTHTSAKRVKPATTASRAVQSTPVFEAIETKDLALGEGLTMRFSNLTRKTVRVYGYLYDLHPRVSLQIRTNSNWRDVELGYCGNGVGNLLLEPGSFVECQVPIPKSNGVYRYGITYRTGTQTNAVWSQEINWTNAVLSATPHAK